MTVIPYGEDSPVSHDLATSEKSTNTLAQQMPRLLSELSELLGSDLESTEFYRIFLDRLVSTTGTTGGAIWLRASSGVFNLAHGHNWNALGLEAIPDGASCHQHVLQVAAQRERPLWVPPHSGRKLVGDDQQAANLTDHGLLLAPVMREKHVVGLVEIWTHSATEGP